MVVVRSRTVSIRHRRRNVGGELGQQRFYVLDRVDDVGARLLVDREQDRLGVVVIGSGETVGSGGDGATDVAYPHRGAIAIGDDDVVERFGLDDLVVGLDGQAGARSRERALGRIGRRIDECAADFLQRQAAGGELCRIDLDPDRRALLAAERDQGDARHLGNLLGEEAVGIFVDDGDRQGVRAGRQDQNRRIGRIELLVGRWRGHGLRQGLARCRDRRLHVLGGEIDVAIEAELYRDRCGAERAERGHLRDAGDLADLAFQRRRDRGWPWSRRLRPQASPSPARSGSRPAAAARPAGTGMRRGRGTPARPPSAMSPPAAG